MIDHFAPGGCALLQQRTGDFFVTEDEILNSGQLGVSIILRLDVDEILLLPKLKGLVIGGHLTKAGSLIQSPEELVQ